MKFTLVSTVFNEGNRLEQTIHDLENQSVKPAEIIITDAGSTDGTYERLLEWKKGSAISVVVLQKNRCNVAEGRNFAIHHATHSLIVSTDFGCRFHQDWLKSLVLPFEDKDTQVVGGAFSVLEHELYSEAAKANYILTKGYMVSFDNQFIPSSRSIAYYKHVWQSVGGYCEWLTLAADDLVFGKALKAKGYKFHLVSEPYVYWMRHEKAAAYGKESFRYGLGDGEARVNEKNTISLLLETSMRYTLLPAAAFLSILSVYTTFWVLPVLLLPFLFGFRPYKAAYFNWKTFKSSKYTYKTLLHAFYLIEITRYNYLKGYYKGYFQASEVQRKGASALKIILK